MHSAGTRDDSNDNSKRNDKGDVKLPSALIVIDIQEKYMDKYDAELVARINGRINEYANEGKRIIYVMNAGKPENADKYLLDKRLQIASDTIFEKKFPSAFSSNEFSEYIEEMKLSEIELVGVDGSSCVAKTAFDAAEKGYDVCINLEYVASINEKIFEDVLLKLEKAGVRIIR